MFSIIFIIIFVLAGLRIASHYPTKVQLSYDEAAITKGQLYRLFTAIFDNQNWIGVLFSALNVFFILAGTEAVYGPLFAAIITVVLSVAPYYAIYRLRSSTEFIWGSLPLIFGLFILNTAINPFGEIRFFFILPLNFVILSALVIGLIIYNQIKRKVPVSGVGFAVSGIAAILLATIFSTATVTHNWMVATGLLLALCAIIYLDKNSLALRPKKAKVIKMNIDQQYNIHKISDQERLNSILDKIKQKGVDALNKDEKRFLDEYSKKQQ
jgi:hypothetical protein